MKLKTTYINTSLQQEKKIMPTKIDKKISVLVVGEVGYYSLFAEGYLRFYSAQKLKIKTTALTKLEVNKKVAKILEDDMIMSKEKLIPLNAANPLKLDYTLHIGDVPPNCLLKTKDDKIHTINIKKDLSLEEKRDFIKKKVLKFLGRQGLYAV